MKIFNDNYQDIEIAVGGTYEVLETCEYEGEFQASYGTRIVVDSFFEDYLGMVVRFFESGKAGYVRAGNLGPVKLNMHELVEKIRAWADEQTGTGFDRSGLEKILDQIH